MSNKEIIAILASLSNYVEENWDPEEYQEDIDKAVKAVNAAIKIIRGVNSCGSLELNGKTYLICKC